MFTLNSKPSSTFTKTAAAVALLAAFSVTPAHADEPMPEGQKMCEFGGYSDLGSVGFMSVGTASTITGGFWWALAGPAAGAVGFVASSLTFGGISLPCPVEEPTPAYTAEVRGVGMGVAGNGLVAGLIAGPGAGVAVAAATAVASLNHVEVK